MLSDDELQALHDIERRLRWERTELARLFNSDELQSVKSHRQRAKARVLLAAAAVTGLTLLGPRMLNEAEVRKQRRRPLPRTAPTTAPSPGGRTFFGCARADGPGRGRGHIPRPLQPSPRRLPPWPMCGKRDSAAFPIGNPSISSRSVEMR